MTVNPLSTEVISQCLAPCEECTGTYNASIIGKKLTCNCPCHKAVANTTEGRTRGHKGDIL